MKIKPYLFLVVIFFATSNTSFSQTYIEQHKKCSEILEFVSIEDSKFWEKLELRNRCLLGLEAPTFEATTVEGISINTDSLGGKVLFLNFWFTKCLPCVQEIPMLNELASKYKNTDVLFLSLANDDNKKLQEFFKTTNFMFKHIPSSRILIDTFKLFSIWPTTIIIDKHGIIQFIQQGKLNNKKHHYKNLIDRLLDHHDSN